MIKKKDALREVFKSWEFQRQVDRVLAACRRELAGGKITLERCGEIIGILQTLNDLSPNRSLRALVRRVQNLREKKYQEHFGG